MLELVGRGLTSALEAWRTAALERTGSPLDAVRLLAPLQPPTSATSSPSRSTSRACDAASTAAAGVAPEWYEAPTFYFTNPHAMVGPTTTSLSRRGRSCCDFELEVAVVIGRDGRVLTPEQAREHVFGYTILNDWSARDLQRREMQVSLGPAKGKDFAITLGPWLVTADELEPYRDADGFLDLGARSRSTASRSAATCCRTWAGRSRS